MLGGTPATGAGGVYHITFTANNGVGTAATQNFTLTVDEAPAIASAKSTNFAVGSPETFTVRATGFPVPTLTESGGLPNGVTFNAASGVLGGTPTTGTAGIYNISFTASNGVGANAVQSFTLAVTTLTVWIDTPASGATISGIVSITGWAVNNALAVGTAISSVQVQVDGTVVGTATYGSDRPDVCAVYPGRPGCPNVGYSYSLNTSTLTAGTHTITVTATNSDPTPLTGSYSVTLTVQATPPTVWIDTPASGATISGIVSITGWAVNNALAVGTAISSVQVQVDGTVVGTATYGSDRPDVCAVYPGRPGCPNVGYSYSLNTSTLTAGTHTITVTATNSDPTPLTGSYSVTLTVQATPPTVWIDTPASGATISGIVSITGWAVNNALAVGTAISSVQVQVDGTVVGTATYGSNRPDVCAVYPGRPGCPNVGYSYSLNTSALSPGTHTFTVTTARNSDPTPLTGSYSVTLTVQGTLPTVWIDAPTQGSTVSGIVSVSGWALDDTAVEGTAISMVQVLLDGTVVGTAAYGFNRPDVCAVYPGRPGCPNVGYSYSLDTSNLSAGSHTVTVTGTNSSPTPLTGSYSVTVTAPNSSNVGTPVWISETSKNSSLSSSLGTESTVPTLCPSNSYCIPYPDATLTGNLGILAFQYANSSAVTVTATDEQNNSYTCLSGSEDPGTSKWNVLCYAPNETAGAVRATITFGTTAVTQATGKAAQSYNIATSSPVDVSASCAGSSSEAANCASVSPHFANDLIYVFVCRTGTPAATSFTAGPGFTLITTDIQDGCASEYEVDSGTDSITPAMTLTPASTYTEFVVAFKAASAGTAPRQPYLQRMLSWGNGQTSATSFAIQFPASGNFLVDANSCGPDITDPTSITDANNTWTQAAGGVVNGNSEYFVTNAGADNLLMLNTPGGAANCNYTFYDYVGLPSNPVVSRSTFAQGTSASGSMTLVNSPGALSWYPSPTTGISILNGNQASDVASAISTPTGCFFDRGYYADELDQDLGAQQVDELDAGGHCYNPGTNDRYIFAKLPTTAGTSWNTDLFGATEANGIIITQSASNSAQSVNSLTINLNNPTVAGNLGMIGLSAFNAAVSTVCLDGTTCAAGNEFTLTTMASGSGHSTTYVAYLLNLPAGYATITVTMTGTAGAATAVYTEVQKQSGDSWATDGSGTVVSGTGNGTCNGVTNGCITGPSVTTTGAQGACMAMASASIGIGVSPNQGNEYIYANFIDNSSGDSPAALLTQSATTHQPVWADNGSAASFSASNACFK